MTTYMDRKYLEDARRRHNTVMPPTSHDTGVAPRSARTPGPDEPRSGPYPTSNGHTMAEVQAAIRDGQRMDNALYPPRG